MDFKEELQKHNLNLDNSVVIGSGILHALGIRKSNDIDVVVNLDTYNYLKKTGGFSIKESHGREVLDDGLFEIGTSWFVLGKEYLYRDLVPESQIINGVRYNSVGFLLRVKRSWVDEKSSRPKDIKDISLMEKYLE